MIKIRIHTFILVVLALLNSIPFFAQDISRKTAYDKEKLIGKWMLLSSKGGTCDKACAEKYIGEIPHLPIHFNSYDSLIFFSDSLCSWRNGEKNHYTIKDFTLTTFENGKPFLIYTIIRLDDFLVITNCTMDCITEFYIKKYD